MSFIGADQDWEDEIKKLRADLDAAESKLAEYAGWSPDQFLRYQDKHKELQERYLQKDTERFNAETALSGVVIERDEAREQFATERTARESLEKDVALLRSDAAGMDAGFCRIHKIAAFVMAEPADKIHDMAAFVAICDVCESAGFEAHLAAHDARLTDPLERERDEARAAYRGEIEQRLAALQLVVSWRDQAKSLERRVGELERAIQEVLDNEKHRSLGKAAHDLLRAALASTPREGTEEPKHYVSGAIELGIYDQLAEQPADPPADREKDDEPLDTPEFTAALEADHAKWLSGRAAKREQVRRELLKEVQEWFTCSDMPVAERIEAELRRLADSGGSEK